jgi:Reverse transcriptase (RNA-dependent DNA polymerase)
MRLGPTAPPVLRAVVDAAGRRRWLTDLDPRDLRRYRRLVAPLVPVIEASLSDGVLANRARPDATLRRIGPARASWDGAIARLASAGPGRAAIVADVRRCYASIGPEAVDRALAEAGIPRSDRAGPIAFLRTLARTGLRGLPIGPAPSAILANRVLALADAAVLAAGGSLLRWVDDVVLVADDPSAAARAFDAWAGALATLGLEPHEGKKRHVPAIDELAACTRVSTCAEEPMP